jgi:hypothetical protein
VVRCQTKGCKVERDVQYIIVHGSPLEKGKLHHSGGSHKEFLCQEHLRKRVLQLEILKLANKARKDLFGWW